MVRRDELPGAEMDEARRLAALHALALLDSEPEREFDALVALAAQMLDCPIALFSLIDHDRLWVKANFGADVRQVDRDVAFCDHTIRKDEPMIIEDVSADPRFTTNPLVTGVNGVRFYAGTPIHAIDAAGDRQAIGTLCVLDERPRSLTDGGRRALAHLASLAEATIAARATAKRALSIAAMSERQTALLAQQDRVFRQAERLAMIGSWRLTILSQKVEWSDGVYHIYGLPVGEMPPIPDALNYYPPQSRALVTEALARTIETGEPFDLEVDFIDAHQRLRRVRTLGERDGNDPDAPALIGVFQDVTDRHALETSLRRSADTDSLTGLANRAAFDRALETAIGRSHRNGTDLLLALIDLDGFKAINDTLGHNAGDDVLRAVGACLTTPWLHGCFAARLGGDEFAVIVDDPTLASGADWLRARLESSLRLPIDADGVAMVCAGTVGVAGLDADCHNVRDFVHRVDTILYAAKRARVGDRRRADRRGAN